MIHPLQNALGPVGRTRLAGGLQPLHYWPFEGDYTDPVGGFTFVPGLGTPPFEAGVRGQAVRVQQSTYGHLQKMGTNTAAIDGGASFTAMGWMKHVAGSPFNNSALYHRTSGNKWFLDTSMSQGESEFIVLGTAGQHSAVGPPFNDVGNWVFLCGTWDDDLEVSTLYVGAAGAALNSYVGIPEGGWSGTRATGSEISAGMWPVGTALLDELRIFDEVLLVEAVQAYYDLDKP